MTFFNATVFDATFFDATFFESRVTGDERWVS
jgi:hypothetical protein